MKKTIEKEVHICDKCGKEESYMDGCESCGTEMCYDCKIKYGKEYNHAVYFEGTGDGFYCKPCDKRLSESRASKLHNAFVEIATLRREVEEFGKNFKKRQELAENSLKAIKRRKYL